MPSVWFQCVESLVITIGAINQNKIKIGSLALEVWRAYFVYGFSPFGGEMFPL